MCYVGCRCRGVGLARKSFFWRFSKISLALRYTSVPNPFQVRCKSVLPPFLTDGRKMGGTRVYEFDESLREKTISSFYGIDTRNEYICIFIIIPDFLLFQQSSAHISHRIPNGYPTNGDNCEENYCNINVMHTNRIGINNKRTA